VRRYEQVVEIVSKTTLKHNHIAVSESVTVVVGFYKALNPPASPKLIKIPMNINQFFFGLLHFESSQGVPCALVQIVSLNNDPEEQRIFFS
jgi:hypothetical protein